MAFRDIAGHRALVQLISRAVDRASLPPSLLFAGPEGVGKRLAATALAQALNCTDPLRGSPPSASGSGPALPLDACGRCSACRRIARGAHSDVLAVEAGEGGAITVDEVRRAVAQARYRPFEGRRRVIVIDAADQLVPQSQNALLKTLEEPPDASQFVLVTARPDTLLATVRSRCQRLSFGQLGTAEVTGVLVRDHGYDQPTALASAASAGGSVGRALLLASGELAAARAAALALLQAVAEASDTKSRLDGAKALLAGRSGGKASGGKAGGGVQRQELTRRLRLLASMLRDVTLLASGADRAALANADLHDRFEPLARTVAARRGVRAFAAVGEALAATAQNASPKVVADWVACRL